MNAGSWYFLMLSAYNIPEVNSYMWKKIKPYAISILIAFAVGGIAALLTKNSMSMYNEIQKPALAPPGWIFPVAWSILYTLMGISSAMVYVKSQGNILGNGIGYYVLSLVFNFFWTIIFFNLRMFLLSFIWLIILWLLILGTISGYSKISKKAAFLQIPYLLWVSFAGYLNFMIYILN